MTKLRTAVLAGLVSVSFFSLSAIAADAPTQTEIDAVALESLALCEEYGTHVFTAEDTLHIINDVGIENFAAAVAYAASVNVQEEWHMSFPFVMNTCDNTKTWLGTL